MLGAERAEHDVDDVPVRGGHQGGRHAVRGQRVEQPLGARHQRHPAVQQVDEALVDEHGQLGRREVHPGAGQQVVDDPGHRAADHVGAVLGGQLVAQLGEERGLRLPPVVLGVDQRPVHVQQHRLQAPVVVAAAEGRGGGGDGGHWRDPSVRARIGPGDGTGRPAFERTGPFRIIKDTPGDPE